MSKKMSLLNLVFYGIGRASAERRRHYIRLVENLEEDFEVNIIEILNDIGKICNPRSNEFSSDLNSLPLFSNSTHIVRDFRKDIIVSKFLKLVSKFDDCHQDNFISTYSLLQQLSMMLASTQHYEAGLVLAIRDDLAFDEKRLTAVIRQMRDTILLDNSVFATSVFHSNRGICERLYFGSCESASVALSRINLVPSYLDEVGNLAYLHMILLRS